MRQQIFGQSADILTSRAGTTAGTVRERRRPHLRTAWRRDNITWMRALQPDLEEVRSWRFCRAQIVSRRSVWVPIFWWTQSFGAYILIGAEISTSVLFLSYIMWRSNFTIPHRFAANICRLHLPPIFCCLCLPPTFAAYICRLYLAHIFAAYIFKVRLHFEQAPTFYDFCNKFCLILLLQIFVYIFSIHLCIFVCANIFGTIVLKPRFKIDVVIMITVKWGKSESVV